MSRIQRTIKGTSYVNPDYIRENPDEFAETGRDMDTADRLREARERLPDRQTRDAEMDGRNQERSTTADYEWRRPTSLEAPKPRPGYVQRWVRAEMRAESDNLNWTGKMREGWRPRDPATVPDCEAFYAIGKQGSSNCIRVGGLILMEMEAQRLQAKKTAVHEQTRRQELSVSMETTKISNEGVRQGYAPIVRDEKSDVTTGTRRPPTLTE